MRGKVLQDINGPLNGKKAYPMLAENLIKSLINITKKGANITRVMIEGVSKKGIADKITSGGKIRENKKEGTALFEGPNMPLNWEGLLVRKLLKNIKRLANAIIKLKDKNNCKVMIFENIKIFIKFQFKKAHPIGELFINIHLNIQGL